MNVGIDFDKFITQASPVEDNYTKKPNVVFDEIMRNVSPNAYKCLDVIIRCTRGYQRDSYPISQSLFQEITGIKRRETVSDAIRELEQLKIIAVDRSTHIHVYFLTLSMYEKTVHVRKNRTELLCTEKPYTVCTDKADIVCTEKPYTIKERKKKENNNTKKQEKFSFADALKNIGADEQLINDWLAVRKTKKASNTKTAFDGFVRELNKSNLAVNTALKICIEKSWQGFNASWLNNINLSEYQDQEPQKTVSSEQPQPIKPPILLRKEYKGAKQ